VPRCSAMLSELTNGNTRFSLSRVKSPSFTQRRRKPRLWSPTTVKPWGSTKFPSFSTVSHSPGKGESPSFPPTGLLPKARFLCCLTPIDEAPRGGLS
jgi:hypothetical protein